MVPDFRRQRAPRAITFQAGSDVGPVPVEASQSYWWEASRGLPVTERTYPCAWIRGGGPSNVPSVLIATSVPILLAVEEMIVRVALRSL